MQKRSRTIDEIIRDVALRLGISSREIKEMYYFTFREMHKHITKPDMPSLLMNGLGVFYVKPGRIYAHALEVENTNPDKHCELKQLLNNKLIKEYKYEQEELFD